MATKSKATHTQPAPAQDHNVTPLQAVFNAAHNAAQGDDTLRKAFVAAGGNQEEPRKMLICGRLAFSLNYTQEKAMLVFSRKGNPKLNPVHEDEQRSPAEEKAYGAARVYLSSRLKAWGIKSTQTQGGDRASSADKTMDTEKLVFPRPKVETTVELGAFLFAQANATYDLFLRNKTHAAVTSDAGAEYMGAAADFLEVVKAIRAKYAPK
jgi:hypothetical protein